jgi:ABC-type hemin transport system ATPase subunit
LGRFDRSGEYAAEGAIDVVAWLRSRCKVSGGEAAQRVGMARQLPQLPQTQKAFASGELGFE